MASLTRALWEIPVDATQDDAHARAVRAASRIEIVDLLVGLGEAALVPLLACAPWGEDPTLQRVVRDAARKLTADDSWMVCLRCGNLLGSAVGYLCELGPSCGAGLVCPLCGVEARFAAADGGVPTCEHFLAYLHDSRSWWPLAVAAPVERPAQRSISFPARRGAIRRALGSCAPLLGDREAGTLLQAAEAWLRFDGNLAGRQQLFATMFATVAQPAGAVAVDWCPRDASDDEGDAVFYFAPSRDLRQRIVSAVTARLRSVVARLLALASTRTPNRDPGKGGTP